MTRFAVRNGFVTRVCGVRLAVLGGTRHSFDLRGFVNVLGTMDMPMSEFLLASCKYLTHFRLVNFDEKLGFSRFLLVCARRSPQETVRVVALNTRRHPITKQPCRCFLRCFRALLFLWIPGTDFWNVEVRRRVSRFFSGVALGRSTLCCRLGRSRSTCQPT